MMPAPSDHIDYGVVQALPGLGPVPGDVWVSKGDGSMFTIVDIQQRKRCWVTVRGRGGEREILLGNLERYYRPHRS